MKILVISDTHGIGRRVPLILRQTGPVDYLIHAGDVEGEEDYIRSIADCPVCMVAGNNDWGTDLKKEAIFRLEDYRFFVTHGHRYGVSMGTERLLDEAKSQRADIAIFGHTHRPYLKKISNVVLMNPGSVGLPRQTGRKPTFGIITIDSERNISFSIGQLNDKSVFSG
ncbi:MAG: metallophosphoesterase family protein [Bilifractor sp.]|jgi:putative phosphoesterase